MAANDKPWWLRPVAPQAYFRSLPIGRLSVLITAVFFLFSVIGFYVDLLYKGALPFAAVLAIAIYCGLNASLWVIVFSRLSRVYLLLLIILQFLSGRINTALVDWMVHAFDLQPVPSEAGIRFAGTAIMSVVALSYIFFIVFIRREGKESLRLRTELELAHKIQETLVPPVESRNQRFEIYGASQPSDKVGGDLVDVVSLPNGDAIAYVADIAGHGLPAGILMGMLKTATRTALEDDAAHEPGRTLPILLGRLNRVLPQVKEPHMYATFTGLRLGVDGSVFYALAASPPLVHWHADGQPVSQYEEPQFPLGLLPVSEFEGHSLEVRPGDLLVVATDGILEVTDKLKNEFGTERLKSVIAANANGPLPKLAARLLETVRAFGPQLDDQTILVVRCL